MEGTGGKQNTMDGAKQTVEWGQELMRAVGMAGKVAGRQNTAC